MNKSKLTLTLDNILRNDMETFRKACAYTSGHAVEILSVEEVDLSDSVLKSGFKVELMASPEDLFWVGRFFERIDNMKYVDLMHYKKSVKVKVPEQLFKLCQLIEVTPEAVLQAFANDVSLTVHGSSGSDERAMAVDYFKRAGHGMHLFDYEEIEQMFDGLEWIRYEWRSYGNPREAEYQVFFKKELKEWFKKWSAAKRKKVTSDN
jgi:hypothetical protein